MAVLFDMAEAQTVKIICGYVILYYRGMHRRALAVQDTVSLALVLMIAYERAYH